MNEKVKVSDHFDYCKRHNIKIEYTENFEITKNVLSGGVDQLYDHEGIYAQLSVGMFDINFDKFTGDGHHFWLSKWMAQDFLERGCIIPLNIGCKRNSNFSGLKNINEFFPPEIQYRVHPGGGKINILNFIKMNIVPAIITSWRDENINFGGMDITNEEDFYSMLSEVEKTYDLFCDYDPGINEIFGDSNMKKLDIYSMGNYKEKAWICDPPSSYSKVIRNSFPLKIYIKGDNFEKCKEKILNNDDRNRMWEEEKSYRMYAESGQVQKGNESYGKISERYEIKVIKLDGDVYDVPELNDYKGFAIFTKSDIEWTNKDVFELLFFGHSEKAMCLYNENVILFNCQHSCWKYTNNPHGEHIGKLPYHYSGGR